MLSLSYTFLSLSHGHECSPNSSVALVRFLPKAVRSVAQPLAHFCLCIVLSARPSNPRNDRHARHSHRHFVPSFLFLVLLPLLSASTNYIIFYSHAGVNRHGRQSDPGRPPGCPRLVHGGHCQARSRTLASRRRRRRKPCLQRRRRQRRRRRR